MDSFFFNITDTSYKVTKIYEKNNDYIARVDISNGIVFFNIFLHDHQDKVFSIKNLDRMVIIPTVKEGKIILFDNIEQKEHKTKKDDTNIYCSSRQDLTITIKKGKKTDIFILFIADFFLKRYISKNKNEPINLLYYKIQGEISFELINTQPVNALSLYIIDKIINVQSYTNMHSIRCEHNVIEFMIYRFSFIDFYDKDFNQEELDIAKKAKGYLLKNFINAPTIAQLAHICATNESKLKKIFKAVYKTTIYEYIQKLRLEKANLLLKDQVLNIGEIAKKVGYRHQGHFSKLFFKNFGIYPKDLLKKSHF